MPNPVRKRPTRVEAVPPESQNRGKPARATQRVAARSVVGGRARARRPPQRRPSSMAPPPRGRRGGGGARARRLPKRRPASRATKKRVRAVAAPGRVRPAPARKSAPQYPTHHSEPTPKVTRAQNAQYRGGNARGPGDAPSRSPATARPRGPRDRGKAGGA